MDRDENPTQTIDAAAPDPQTVDRLLGGAHHDPHSILGAHPSDNGTIVRVLRPHADEVHVVRVGDEDHPLVKVHDAGLFSGVVPGPPADYRLAVRYGDRVDIVDDPYRWLPTLGEIDLHLISEGRHERLWDVLGAHVRSYDTPAGTVTGTSFAVWAPTAQGVRVTGDFDGWSGWAHPMRVLGQHRDLGAVRPGHHAGCPLQVPDPRGRRSLARQGRSARVPHRDPARDRVHRGCPHARVGRRAVDDHPGAEPGLRRAHERLRGPPGLVAAGAELPRDGPTARRLPRRDRLHPRRADADHRASRTTAPGAIKSPAYFSPTARFGTPDDFR